LFRPLPGKSCATAVELVAHREDRVMRFAGNPAISRGSKEGPHSHGTG
jgi:hypothetical protein